MPGTYTQLYVHVVFATKRRRKLIPRNHRETLNKYITGIVTNKKHKILAVNNEPDHIHLLIGFRSSANISDIIRDIKANSSRFINEQKWCNTVFEWQNGYGAFTCNHPQIPIVANYIANQEKHHQKIKFTEEYIEFLVDHEVSFKPEHVFDE